MLGLCSRRPFRAQKNYISQANIRKSGFQVDDRIKLFGRKGVLNELRLRNVDLRLRPLGVADAGVRDLVLLSDEGVGATLPDGKISPAISD